MHANLTAFDKITLFFRYIPCSDGHDKSILNFLRRALSALLSTPPIMGKLLPEPPYILSAILRANLAAWLYLTQDKKI